MKFCCEKTLHTDPVTSFKWKNWYGLNILLKIWPGDYIEDYTAVWIVTQRHNCDVRKDIDQSNQTIAVIWGIVWFDWSLSFLTSQLWHWETIQTEVLSSIFTGWSPQLKYTINEIWLLKEVIWQFLSQKNSNKKYCYSL